MNQFEVTDDNRPFLEARGKIVLNACPGSGKTSAIAYKLTKLSDECTLRYGAFAGIACLSFTNVAKEEIAAKYHTLTNRQLAFPHVVLTLDSFVNQYITLPFYHMMQRPTSRPIIMDVVSFLDGMNWGGFRAVNGKPLDKVLKPSKLKLEMNASVTWDGHVPKATTVDNNVFKQYGNKVKLWQLNNGYLDNDDSAVVAYRLLLKYPEIAKSLVARFPYIIVDEAQDTSELQYAIFDQLVAAGLKNLEYVGDPYQSLYEFREARPDLFLDRFRDTGNWQALRLKDCRRTSQQIINVYSLLRDVREAPIVSTCTHASDHRLKVLHYDPANLQSLITGYETLIDPKIEKHILVRGTSHLEMFGVKPSSEEPWKNGIARILMEAQTHYLAGKGKAAVDTLRKFLAEVRLPGLTHREHRDYREKLKEDSSLNMQLFDFLREMPSIDDTLKDWTDKMTAYVETKLLLTVDFGLKQKGKAFYNQNLKAMLFPVTTVTLPVSTIHRVKGKTFQSVLLVLSEDSKAANISLSDFARPNGLPSEKQRMIYVALSRPEILACIAVPQSISREKVVAVLGDYIEFV